MPYVEVLVSIPRNKLVKLLEGEEVQVFKRDLKPLYPLYFLKKHVLALNKFVLDAKAKDSMPLKFSQAHLRHIMKEWDQLETLDGSGFWSRFKRFFKKAGSAIWKGVKAVAPIVKAVAPVLINTVPGAKEVVDVGREIGKQAGVGEQVDAGLKQVLGVGIGKAKRAPSKVKLVAKNF